MRLARVDTGEGPRVVVARHDGWTPITGLGTVAARRPSLLADLLGPGALADLRDALERAADADPTEVHLPDALTVVDAGDVWGVGLNYTGHADDLGAQQPTTGPGSYLRPRGCLIGNGEPIELPAQSARVTAEAELGLVVGTACKNVRREDWRSVVAAVTAVLDMTAEDAIRENPRHIPWAKGFDTFCSVGPQIVTLDELDDDALRATRVSTVRNGETIASAPTSAMKYDLGFLVEYFTAGRTLTPGTVICTGTPGAAVVEPGDQVSSIVEGIGVLSHAVKG